MARTHGTPPTSTGVRILTPFTNASRIPLKIPGGFSEKNLHYVAGGGLTGEGRAG
jgi:hypothetical protein